MATVPQRELRNNTARLLKRVERGERITITVHNHPVADLVPTRAPRTFVPLDEVQAGLRGLLTGGGDRLKKDIQEMDGPAEDPFG